jgi:4-diphosphocytidyl-2-C-methyl-D-erythritol kinase
MKSPAKINLGLNILRKRDDGYHDIESIMYQIGLNDTLIFEKTEGFAFATQSVELSADPTNNLIVKAVRKLENYCGKRLMISIELEKHIPMGAGLGGGSSNAAITLTALNELFGLSLPDKTIFRLAAELGSDVPFFVKPAPAYATSRGEILQRFAFDLPFHILVVNPGIHVSTVWAYKNVTPSMPERPLSAWLKS